MSVRLSTATIALRTRPRPSLGPALGRSRLPLGTFLVSAVLHLLGLGALGLAAMVWQDPPQKTYIVNLVPAVAAIGRPQGQARAPALPPRPSEVTPAPTKTAPRELPQREAHTPPPAPPEMPARRIARDTTTLPDRDRALPSRAAALPRPGDKELPASALPRASSEPSPTPRRETAPSVASAPPVPLGQAAGSLQGAGAVTLSVSDFPYAWYIQAIHRKIQERWEGRAINGRQPEVIFVIGADGRLRGLEIGKSSGNAAYDQQALRAVSDANPFPPLPDGFGKSALKVGLQFVYDPRAR
jgi:protein TonB